MVVWLIFAVMTAAVAVSLARTLGRPCEAPQEGLGTDAAIYKDQLAEIEADRARELISDADAEAARVEISRRLLAATDRPTAGLSPDPVQQATVPLTFVYCFAMIVGAIALAAYLALGTPWLGGQPYAERVAAKVARDGRLADLIGAVERRLKDHPEDGRGWDVIAPIYLRQGRYPDAAAAYANASRLLGEAPNRLAGFAQATILARDGLVTEPARTAFERLLKLQPTAPEPKFWIAVAKEQDGQLEAAAQDLAALLKSATPGAPWRSLVAARLSQVQEKLGIDTPPSGPTEDDVAAAAKMSPEARVAMIRQMVSGLADKLSENGRDLEGWKKLVRSYLVLGDRAKALEALGNARKGLAGDAEGLGAIDALAEELGLKS